MSGNAYLRINLQQAANKSLNVKGPQRTDVVWQLVPFIVLESGTNWEQA